jgi:hypothetical protein
MIAVTFVRISGHPAGPDSSVKQRSSLFNLLSQNQEIGVGTHVTAPNKATIRSLVVIVDDVGVFNFDVKACWFTSRFTAPHDVV